MARSFWDSASRAMPMGAQIGAQGFLNRENAEKETMKNVLGLFQNAVKMGEDGSPLLEGGLKAIGQDPQKFPHLFEMLKTADASTRKAITAALMGIDKGVPSEEKVDAIMSLSKVLGGAGEALKFKQQREFQDTMQRLLSEDPMADTSEPQVPMARPEPMSGTRGTSDLMPANIRPGQMFDPMGGARAMTIAQTDGQPEIQGRGRKLTPTKGSESLKKRAQALRMMSAAPGASPNQAAVLRDMANSLESRADKMLTDTFLRKSFQLYGRAPETAAEIGNVEKIMRYEENRAAVEKQAATKDVEPLHAAELKNWKGPNGESPPPGATLRYLKANKFRLSAEGPSAEYAPAIKAALDQIRPVINKHLIGEVDKKTGKIKGGVQAGVLNRLAKGGQISYDLLAQNVPELNTYNSTVNGMKSILARALGERGALNEGDIQRISYLFPVLVPVPDSGPVAQKKMEALDNLIKIVSTGKFKDATSVTAILDKAGVPQVPTQPAKPEEAKPEDMSESEWSELQSLRQKHGR